MIRFLAFVWREHRIAGIIFCIALLALFQFVADFAGKAIHFSDPANQERLLEPWMPPRYVADSWRLPKDVLFEVLGQSPDTPPHELPRTIGQYLEESGMTLAQLQAKVEAAKQQLQESEGQ